MAVRCCWELIRCTANTKASTNLDGGSSATNVVISSTVSSCEACHRIEHAIGSIPLSEYRLCRIRKPRTQAQSKHVTFKITSLRKAAATKLRPKSWTSILQLLRAESRNCVAWLMVCQCARAPLPPCTLALSRGTHKYCASASPIFWKLAFNSKTVGGSLKNVKPSLQSR